MLGAVRLCQLPVADRRSQSIHFTAHEAFLNGLSQRSPFALSGFVRSGLAAKPRYGSRRHSKRTCTLCHLTVPHDELIGSSCWRPLWHARAWRRSASAWLCRPSIMPEHSFSIGRRCPSPTGGEASPQSVEAPAAYREHYRFASLRLRAMIWRKGRVYVPSSVFLSRRASFQAARGPLLPFVFDCKSNVSVSKPPHELSVTNHL